MRILCFILIFLFFPSYLSFPQEEERSPIYFRGIDVCMTPKEVINILGEPNDVDAEYDGDFIELLWTYYYYYFPDGIKCKIGFYEGRWLIEIDIYYPEALPYPVFGLDKKGALGFEFYKSINGEKRWKKYVSTDKWRLFTIKYVSLKDNENLIACKKMYIHSSNRCGSIEKLKLGDGTPMCYKEIDVGMDPEQVKTYLDEPDERESMGNDLLYNYYLPGGGCTSLFFHRCIWLKCIIIEYSAPLPLEELGLEEDGGSEYKTYLDDDGNKHWEKTVETEKFGVMVVGYRCEPGNLSLIGSKIVYVVNPEILEQY